MRTRWTWTEIALLAAITAMGVLLRWWHLDLPSFWWDELIHIGTAQQPDTWEVIRRVKLGSPPGSGNAGAVPLDYVLLHWWQRLVPLPDPERIEGYFRFPSFLWSSLTPLALHVLGRRVFGPAVGLAAAACLALSPFHVAYAAEARFYSLFGLMTVVNLLCFSWVVQSRRPVAWWLFTLHGAVYFWSGLFGLLVLGIEYAALAADVALRWWRRRARPDEWHRSELLFLTVTGVVIALVPIFYYQGTDLFTKTERSRPPIDTLSAWSDAAWLYLSKSIPLAIAAGLGLVACGWQAARGRVAWPIAAVLAGAAVLICPIILEIERWKLYYFHPRHAVFLMPVVALLVGLGVATCLGSLPALLRRATTVLAPACVVACLATPALAFLERPTAAFWRTKVNRDVPMLMRELSARLDGAPEKSKILLLAPSYRGGRLLNVTVLRYLEWWNLASRVVFRSYPIFSTVLDRLESACEGTCRGRSGLRVERAMAPLEGPVRLPPSALALLGTDGTGGKWPGKVWSVVIVDYGERVPVRPGFVTSGGFGIRRWQLDGDPPPHPSTFVAR